MEREIVKINPNNYGLHEKQTNELTSGLNVILKERELLIKEFEQLSKLEILEENLSKFRELRLKIVKNRTQGINRWHKNAKDYFLKGGQFVDAIKRKEVAVNEGMEEKLIKAEKYFEIQEQKRLKKLQEKRVSELLKYFEDAELMDLSGMQEEVYNAFLNTKKQEYLEKIEAEKKAEAERIAKEKAEKEEQERIRKENERLKKEREERERQLKIEAEKREKAEKERKAKEEAERKKREEIERKKQAEFEAKLRKEREERERIEREEKEKREKIEAELIAREEAELKEKEEAERLLQLELNKDDFAKVKDLINDLNSIKVKYSFKSDKNNKMLNGVKHLIDKIIYYIEKY